MRWMTSYATAQSVLHYILFNSHSAHLGRVFALDFHSVDVDLRNNHKLFISGRLIYPENTKIYLRKSLPVRLSES